MWDYLFHIQLNKWLERAVDVLISLRLACQLGTLIALSMLMKTIGGAPFAVDQSVCEFLTFSLSRWLSWISDPVVPW